MGLALATVFFFLAGSCLYLASHGLEASTPWGAYSTVLGKIREAAS
jgi:hypothetical protein